MIHVVSDESPTRNLNSTTKKTHKWIDPKRIIGANFVPGRNLSGQFNAKAKF